MKAESIDFGRHKGTLWTRVPVSYLKWMVCAKHQQAPRAQAELDRRGTTTPDLDVSNHAIDRASLRLRKRWHETRDADEGIASWLIRMATAARKDGARCGDRIHYNGICFVFEDASLTAWPVLKTVMPSNEEKASP